MRLIIRLLLLFTCFVCFSWPASGFHSRALMATRLKMSFNIYSPGQWKTRLLALDSNGLEADGVSKTTVKTRISQKIDQIAKSSYIEDIESDWRLVLHDDTIHTIEDVCDIITEAMPVCPGPRAYEITLEVHMSGAATVAVANKKIIDEYCKSLQRAGLSVSMSPDAAFEKDADLI